MWEDSGWIVKEDPYGWFQWYCRYSMGRRSDDDERQIKRWLALAGPNGRFRRRLMNEIIKKKKRYNDSSVSPVIRQVLLHWGYELTSKDLQKYKNKLNNHAQEFEKYLETINRQIKDIEKLVNEFSNFARMPRPILKKINIVNLVKKSMDFINIGSKLSLIHI